MDIKVDKSEKTTNTYYDSVMSHKHLYDQVGTRLHDTCAHLYLLPTYILSVIQISNRYICDTSNQVPIYYIYNI